MLTVESIRKRFAGAEDAPAALDGVSFHVAPGDFFTLLGPSGCGKTTTLQCIAGLEAPDSGRITMGGDVVFCSERRIAVPANRRNLGMVFQSYAIWPHMTVHENVAFPLVHGMRKAASGEVGPRVRRALERVKLDALADRPAPLLSGGQQQRVALARALVHEPRLLLLDEPLSNLDAKLRDQMRVELRQLVKSLGITTVFVTHDQTEAMAMSDRVALMRQGRVVQLGSPRDLFLKPASAFAADFMGRTNMIRGRLVQAGPPAAIATPLGLIGSDGAPGLPAGAEVFAVVRPQAVTVLPDDAPADGLANVFRGRVIAQVFLGDVVEADLAVGEGSLRVLLSPYREAPVGAALTVEIPPAHCVVVPAEER
ncbi:MAG: ABC transporter ATP-binding protein [Alphaproteobacteria bacterium]|nr:ABC transporter ATP-binding protein [Alphaproteobacteria bacterium]